MPEAPEVESVVRALHPLVQGHRVRSVHIFHPIATKPQVPRHVIDLVEGQTIHRADRKGKYLILRLESGIVTVHFRLDGQIVWFKSAAELLQRANQGRDGVHVDVALELDEGVMGFADRRHFGRLHAWTCAQDYRGLAALGVDALSPGFTARRLTQLLSRSRRPLKEFLLDQTKIAGIGNMYSSESLWLARLHPRRRGNSLGSKEGRRLHKAIVSVLRRALECCMNPAPDFRNPAWWFQGLEEVLCVYGRKGLPCRRCGNPIRRIEQAGRSTYFCAPCQK